MFASQSPVSCFPDSFFSIAHFTLLPKSTKIKPHHSNHLRTLEKRVFPQTVQSQCLTHSLRKHRGGTRGGTPAATQLFPSFSTSTKRLTHTSTRNSLPLYALLRDSLYTPSIQPHPCPATHDHKPFRSNTYKRFRKH